MRLAVRVSLLVILALNTAFAAEESCEGRCRTFNAQWRCQCDSMCVYHRSCCHDFQMVCRNKITRGDTFDALEDIHSTTNTTGVAVTTAATAAAPNPTVNHVTTSAAPAPTTRGPTSASDPDAVPCSGRPFDAFLQLKNGSIYAFRGDYFFELNEISVMPGYPKRIKDVWGIPGPIDAAFTRINCQGKTYIFKGNQYWRFEGDVLDADYPRDISMGFEKMPNDVNAAFAIPAPSCRGKEKVYFFKGDQYHQYEFKHQPSHEECVTMTRSSPSMMFTQYTNLYYDQLLEELFAQLFEGPFHGQNEGPRLISRDWLGIQPPVDAAMVGRLYLSPKATATPPQARPAGGRGVLSKRRGRGRGQRGRGQRGRGQRGRQSRSLSYVEDFFSYNYEDYGDDDDYNRNGATHAVPGLASQSVPVQSVYFFKNDKYYRLSLETKRVERVTPRYPRSIAKYWLGCDGEESVDVSRAEKR